MAMKPCKECKSPISSSATICPRCGKKNPAGSNTGKMILLLIGLLIFGKMIGSLQFGNDNQSPNSPQGVADKSVAPPIEIASSRVDDESKKLAWIERCKDSVREKLKDPESANFKNVEFRRGFKNLPIVFGEVNSKNSFGAYGGFQRFISAGEPGLTFLEEQMESAEFAKSWREMRSK